MMDIVIGNIGGANVPPMAQIKRTGALQCRRAKIEVGFAVPIGVLEIMLKEDHEDTQNSGNSDGARKHI